LPPRNYFFANSFGNFATLAAIRRASSLVSSLAYCECERLGNR
jgi:hypothetical protein